MEVLPPPLPIVRVRRAGARPPWRILSAVALVVLAAVVFEALVWRHLARGYTGRQRVLLARTAATMAAPAFGRDKGEVGLDNRFAWALPILAAEMKIAPERLNQRLSGFGDSIWGGLENTAYDRALRAISQRRLQTALEEALTAAHKTDAAPLQRRASLMLAGELLLSTLRMEEGGETPEKLFRAALATCDKEIEPLAWADAQAFLAESLRLRARNDEARPLAEEALAVREKEVGADDPSLLRWLLGRGLVSTSTLESYEWYKRALPMQQVSGTLTRRELQHLQQDCGRILFNAGKNMEAEPHLLQAIAIGETTGQAGALDLARALSDLGAVYAQVHLPNEAEPLLLRGLGLIEATAGLQSDEMHPPLLGLTHLKIYQQDWPAAEKYGRRALAIAQRSHATDRRYLILSSYSALTDIMRLSDRPIEAEKLYREQLAAAEKSFGPENLNTTAVLGSLAVVLRQQNRFAEAERLMRQALTIEDRLLPANDPRRAVGLGNLGKLLAYTGRPQEGEILLLRAVSFFARQENPDPVGYAIYLQNLGEVYMMLGRREEGDPMYRKALSMLAKAQVKRGNQPPEVPTFIGNYALALEASGQDHSTALRNAEAAMAEALVAAQNTGQ